MADKGIAIRTCPARLPRASGLSAAALILVVACSSGGSGSAGTPLTPRQALLATATQAQKVTSASETLAIHGSGIQSVTTTGIIQFQRKPLKISENLKVAAAGKRTQIKAIVTDTAVYFNEASLARQLGKPWVKVDLSALNSTPLAGIAQLIHSLQSNNFANQAQLFAATKNVRVVGKQTIDGVPTTEYAGSFRAAEALKALSPSFRKVLAPALQVLGNSPVSFHVWVDSQHHTRKMTEIETINGEAISTTLTITAINQPVHIAPPPASQTVTPPSGS